MPFLAIECGADAGAFADLEVAARAELPKEGCAMFEALGISRGCELRNVYVLPGGSGLGTHLADELE